MGGGGRSGILVAWTGSVSSRSSSGMARVGGEHLGAGVGILFCLIGHATTAAAAGAFPGSSVSPSVRQSVSQPVRSRRVEWRQDYRSRGWQLACLLSLPASPRNEAGVY